ncbi:hypothetical protein [Pedobacter sp. MC2016-24]|uniref:hypothetical protein n=1 Tax=Pedobacter sp. MC2016-24 TaxID=2780090 RepID=UPI00188276BB|nr:hypothetical protein [Pedobacter sp. MC2016-24]MBE9598522.1 hypothetical protein [Pedobacter sp. MC2016-24]
MMKTNILLISLMVLMYSCRNADVAKTEAQTLYSAIHQNDTATLKIRLTDKDFYGQLETNYHGLYKDSGGVTGVVKGNILKGTYKFQHYGMEKWHSIPITFLKKDGKLILGQGDMEIYMGMFYFKKNKPIVYDTTKFVFEKHGL